MATMDNQIWQDRDIRFDVLPQELLPRRGEFQIDSMNGVEDTKGNNGERGELRITNLRVVWWSARSKKTNLSIGYNCIVSLNIKVAQSRLRGNTQALYTLTKYNGSRFEFIFTNLVRNSPRIFTTVQAVFRAYETTKLYRDLKLRGAIIREGTLNLLPHEQVFKHMSGVWNLSSDQGNLGTFYITNVRLVWHANLAENFNVSIPYLQMKTIRMRESKFGRALVIETISKSGGYILGFRVDPQDKLEAVFQEITSLHQVYSVNPMFGIDFVHEEKEAPLNERTVKRVMEDVEIEDETQNELNGSMAVAGDVFAAYYADGGASEDRPPVYSTEIGLAVETLKPGFTLENMWNAL